MNETYKKILFILACVAVLTIGGFLAYSTQNGGILNVGKQLTTVPEESTFYLAQKGNEPILFYRFSDMMIEHKKPARTVGHFAQYQKPYDIKKDPNEFVDYKELENPKKLFSFEGHAGIENYILSEDKKYLLLSFIGGPTDTTNYIYQIDLQNQTSKKLWEHELRSGEPPYNAGVAYVTHFIPNEYIAFAIIKSTPPPDALPESVIVMNNKSGEEKVLGVVGDVTIDLSEKTVSYKELEKTPVPCKKNDPVCFATDTYKYAYKPGGDPVTQPLP